MRAHAGPLLRVCTRRVPGGAAGACPVCLHGQLPLQGRLGRSRQGTRGRSPCSTSRWDPSWRKGVCALTCLHSGVALVLSCPSPRSSLHRQGALQKSGRVVGCTHLPSPTLAAGGASAPAGGGMSFSAVKDGFNALASLIQQFPRIQVGVRTRARARVCVSVCVPGKGEGSVVMNGF